MYRSVIVVEEFMTMLACWSNTALYPNTHFFLLSSLFDFGEKFDYLTSSQQNNTLPYQLQTSYPSSQPQHQPQTSLPRMSYLTPTPYLTPNAPDSNPTSYLTFGPTGTSTGMVTYSTGGHSFFQSQNTGQILLQSAGHHGELLGWEWMLL